jgi:ATPase subunit of ABC transporter with duplicated ATPase domains
VLLFGPRAVALPAHMDSRPSLHFSVLFITGNGQQASVAESGSCSRPHKVREGHMPQSHFSHGQETIRAAAESRQECADFIRRGRAEFAETRAATLKAIAESREFMTKIDADMREP